MRRQLANPASNRPSRQFTFQFGTFRTWRDVGFESVMSSKADAYEALQFKLIFLVLLAGGG
jgi:hypothetical protein